MNPFYIIPVVILLSASTYSKVQTKNINAGGIEIQISAKDSSLNDIFCAVGEMPEFPGGTKKLFAFAKSHMKYPETAINDNVQGTVLLQFVIDKKGFVTERKIIKGVRPDLNRTCLAMLSQMPRWKAGRLNGKPIETYERWKIIFILTER